MITRLGQISALKVACVIPPKNYRLSMCANADPHDPTHYLRCILLHEIADLL